MRLIARAPIDSSETDGGDQRSGDTFEVSDKAVAQRLIDSGKADALEEPAKAKRGKGDGGE